VKLSRSGWGNNSSTSVDYLGIRQDGLSGFQRARIPSLLVGAAARVGSGCALLRSFSTCVAKPVRKSAHQDLTCVR
jgi:hypothetical protein